MVRRVVANARRSQLVSTYGVGALFPAEDQSLMICGLDEWPEDERNTIDEPRLAASLGVIDFRMPASGRRRGDVPTVRFPEMHFCVQCRALKPRWQFCADDRSICRDCGGSISPSRFVACCRKGHIQDFPYWAWVHSGRNVSTGGEHAMRITARGKSSSLSDIVISCSCGVPPVTLAGSFQPAALRGIANCRGLRPWLVGAEPEANCSEQLRVLQRGSSNVWFPVVRSAISIPPWSDEAYQIARRYFKALRNTDAEQLPAQVLGVLQEGATEHQVEAVVRAVRELRGDGDQALPQAEADLRTEEYKALLAGRPEHSPRQQFVCVDHDLSSTRPLMNALAQLADVPRLREVRALQSFSRLSPAAEDGDSNAALSIAHLSWLPAIEVLGEGIFIRLEESRLSAWERTSFARSRIESVQRAVEAGASEGSWSDQLSISARGLLLHSLAHVLITELSLDAGYPEASLRERLYTAEDQAGVLIYTATADSAGSLGGLSAKSEPRAFESVLSSALQRAQWCTNDPVCVEAQGTGVGGLNLAACHACMLLPETSCERFNSLLDRASLVGLPGGEALGFFTEWLS
jgi:hypothetical protein